MPNIKSAIKRVKVEDKKNLENRMTKSAIATEIKKFKSAVDAKDFVQADALYKNVARLLDSAVSKNTVHQNYADRRKAHFAKVLDTAKNIK